ncbi:MAG: hypothetical protein RSE52_05840 [Erysipelotrichaceae bacterium]
MKKNRLRGYLDVVICSGDTLEQIEADIERLEEENAKLTEWPEIL